MCYDYSWCPEDEFLMTSWQDPAVALGKDESPLQILTITMKKDSTLPWSSPTLSIPVYYFRCKNTHLKALYTKLTSVNGSNQRKILTSIVCLFFEELIKELKIHYENISTTEQIQKLWLFSIPTLSYTAFEPFPSFNYWGWLWALSLKLLWAVRTWLHYFSRLHKQVSTLEAQGRVKARGKYDQFVLSLGSDCTAV